MHWLLKGNREKSTNSSRHPYILANKHVFASTPAGTALENAVLASTPAMVVFRNIVEHDVDFQKTRSRIDASTSRF